MDDQFEKVPRKRRSRFGSVILTLLTLVVLAAILGVVGIYAVTKTQGGLVYLVIGYSGVRVLVSLSVSFWLFLVHKPQFPAP